MAASLPQPHAAFSRPAGRRRSMALTALEMPKKAFLLKMPNKQTMTFLVLIVLFAIPAIAEARAGPEPKAKAQNEAENYNEYNEYGEEYGELDGEKFF